MRPRRIAGYALLAAGWIMSAVAFALYVAASSTPRLDQQLGPVEYWLLIGSAIVLPVLAWQAFDTGRRLRALNTGELLARDQRPPVIYLRSFAADIDAAREEVVGNGQLTLPAGTDEEVLAEVLNEIGPLIAIGRPGEKLPLRGAARVYVSDEDWQKVVSGWLRRARLVVLRAGGSDGLLWEFSRVIDQVEPERLIVLVPEAPGVYEAFHEKVSRLMPKPLPSRPPKPLSAAGLIGFIWFDHDWTGFFERIGRRLPVRRRFLMPAYAPLRSAFDPLIQGQMTKSEFTCTVAELNHEIEAAKQARLPALAFVGRWTLYTLFAYVLAAILLPRIPESAGIDFLWQSAIAGLSLGVGQWFLLRGYLINAEYWIHMTILAFLVSNATFHAAQYVVSAWLIAFPVMFGAILGISQWLVLRTLGKSSLLWIPTVAFAWGLGGGLAAQVGELVYHTELPFAVQVGATHAVAAIFGGMITGAQLASLLGLRQAATTQPFGH